MATIKCDVVKPISLHQMPGEEDHKMQSGIGFPEMIPIKEPFLKLTATLPGTLLYDKDANLIILLELQPYKQYQIY